MKFLVLLIEWFTFNAPIFGHVHWIISQQCPARLLYWSRYSNQRDYEKILQLTGYNGACYMPVVAGICWLQQHRGGDCLGGGLYSWFRDHVRFSRGYFLQFFPNYNICTAQILLQLNHADLSPNHSGILFGITNTVAATQGFAAPIAIGYITNNNAS